MKMKNILMTMVVVLIVIGMKGIVLGDVANSDRDHNGGDDGHNNGDDHGNHNGGDDGHNNGDHGNHNGGDDGHNNGDHGNHNGGDDGHNNGGDHGKPKPTPTPVPTPVPAVTPDPTPVPAVTSIPPAPVSDPAPIYESINSQQGGFFWAFGKCDCDRMRILTMLENQTSNETAIKVFNYKLEVIAWDSRKLSPQEMMQFCTNSSYDMSPTETYYGMDKD